MEYVNRHTQEVVSLPGDREPSEAERDEGWEPANPNNHGDLMAARTEIEALSPLAEFEETLHAQRGAMSAPQRGEIDLVAARAMLEPTWPIETRADLERLVMPPGRKPESGLRPLDLPRAESQRTRVAVRMCPSPHTGIAYGQDLGVFVLGPDGREVMLPGVLSLVMRMDGRRAIATCELRVDDVDATGLVIDGVQRADGRRESVVTDPQAEPGTFASALRSPAFTKLVQAKLAADTQRTEGALRWILGDGAYQEMRERLAAEDASPVPEEFSDPTAADTARLRSGARTAVGHLPRLDPTRPPVPASQATPAGETLQELRAELAQVLAGLSPDDSARAIVKRRLDYIDNAPPGRLDEAAARSVVAGMIDWVRRRPTAAAPITGGQS